MIYFDNAATTLPKPPEVAKAVETAINSFGNPSRGAHDATLMGLRCLFEAREKIAKLFHIPDPMRVAFTPNATFALNIAISNIKGHIVTTAAEHNSVLRPVFKRGDSTIVPVDNLGRLSIEEIERAILPSTEAIVVCHASNLIGNVYDIEAIGELCKSKGLKLIVDAAQTAGLIQINATDVGISALCFSGHKSLYGPQGTGGICLSTDFTPTSFVVGGSGSDSFSLTHPSKLPDALEAGTQNSHGIAGLLAGIKYVNSLNGNAHTISDVLARKFIEEALKINKVVLYGDISASVRTPVVALNINGIDSATVATKLFDKYEIAVRAGAHCAPLMHKALGTEKTGSIRFSFSHFNSNSEIDFAIQALKEISKKG